MARLADPNEKAPQEPYLPPSEPSPPKTVAQIPKEGVTAGDLAMQDVPDPKKDPYGYMLFVMAKGFEGVHARLDQQGKLVADMAEKVYGPQGEGQGQAMAPKGPAGIMQGIPWQDLLQTARQMIGGGEDKIYTDIGRQVVDGATNTAIKSIIRSVGREAAGNVVHIG